MNRTNEITLLPNPAYHTMRYNGYVTTAIIHDELTISGCVYENVVFFKFNKEYFN